MDASQFWGEVWAVDEGCRWLWMVWDTTSPWLFFRMDIATYLSANTSAPAAGSAPVEITGTEYDPCGGSGLLPFADNAAARPFWLSHNTFVVACADGTIGYQIKIMQVEDSVEGASVLQTFSMAHPQSMAAVGHHYIVLSQPSDPALVWFSLATSSVSTTGSLHSKGGQFLLSTPTQAVSIGYDGVGIWQPSCGMEEGRMPLKACPRPCEGDHFPSHAHVWWTTICKVPWRHAYIYHIGGIGYALPVVETYYAKVVYQQSSSDWVALFYHLDEQSSGLVRMDVYDLSSSRTHTRSEPSPVFSFTRDLTGLTVPDPFGPSCGDWLVFGDCLLHLSPSPSHSPSTWNDTSIHPINFDAASPPPYIIITFTSNCSLAAVDVGSTQTQFLSLSSNGTVTPVDPPPPGLARDWIVAQANLLCQHLRSDMSYQAHTLSPDAAYVVVECGSYSDSVLALSSLPPSAATLLAWASDGWREAFSPDSRFLAFRHGSNGAIGVWDLSRQLPDIASNELALSVQRPSDIYVFGFSPDSQYVMVRYDTGQMEAFPVTWRGYVEQACGIAGRDLTSDEWTSYGLLDVKDHPICPGPAFTEGTCFGVPYGADLVVNASPTILNVCPLGSFSYAAQFSFHALPNTTYQLTTALSGYPTRIGVYDSRCSLPALAYTMHSDVTIRTPSDPGPLSQPLHVIVSSTEIISCGTLRLGIRTALT